MFKQPDESIIIGSIWNISEVTMIGLHSRGFPLRNTNFLTLSRIYVHVILYLEVYLYKIYSFPVRVTNVGDICSEIVLTGILYC